ncbi:MAG: trigger factor, partial [Candidatus Tectomicrobia bacterium]|nr:trigger factor [Candidatus Tectomicrobia bacterium]
MKVEIEQLATCVRRLTIEVPADKVNSEFSTIYNDLQQRVRMPGFRQGKVPRRLLENYYRQSVEQEVLRKLVPEALTEVITKENVASVGEPQIDQITLVKGQPLRFVATTQVIPEFTLTDYHGWQCDRRIAEVTEAHIDQALENVRARHAMLQTVEGRPVQDGDVVLMDYTGLVDGQPMPGFAGTKVSIEVGSGQSFTEIEQGLLGMSQGDEKTIHVHFPDDFRTVALAGKTGQCQVTVAEIKEKHLPALDDDFARSVYDDIDSLEALRVKVRQELEKNALQRADAVVQQDILQRLVAAHPIEVPEVLLHDELRRAYLQHRRQSTDGQLTEADYQVAPESLQEAFGEQALEAVRGQLILRHIATEAEITVEPEEVDAEVVAMAARTAQNADALKRTMERNGTLRALELNLLEAKVFAKIMADLQMTDTIVHADAVVS